MFSECSVIRLLKAPIPDILALVLNIFYAYLMRNLISHFPVTDAKLLLFVNVCRMLLSRIFADCLL